MRKKLKIMFCGGGTAGHITPAIAIAQAAKSKGIADSILFIGRDGGSENELTAKAGFPYTTIPVSGIQRRLTLKNVNSIYKALHGKFEAKRIIKAFSPDFIIGTGGYVCWPVLKAGYEMKIPIYLHESNIYPGLTTRLLARKCNKVFLYSNETASYLHPGSKTCVVGNPISKSFFTTIRSDARRQLTLSADDIFILSFGGSLGAERINEAVFELMRRYSSKSKIIYHLHATGKNNYKTDYGMMFNKEERCGIVPFLDNMPMYLKAADIVICRSGAMTIAELAATGSAAILIPSPNVAENHQLKNAMALSNKNAAIVIPEETLSAEYLMATVSRLTRSKEEREKMSKCIEKFAKTNVEDKILSEILSIKKQG